MKRTSKTMIGASVLLFALAAGAFQVARQRTAAAPTALAAMLPQGALLTIESPDFSALLQRWNASPEQKAWLGSDDYAVFSNSRLFGRLNDARGEFEAAAKSAANQDPSLGGDFLTQVAGKQSIFAWYDVGNLEFLYITRMPAAQSANIELLKARPQWTSRQAGGVTFYLRKSTPAAGVDAEAAQGKARTVAFARDGDWLVLATREDLIANALQLMHPAANAETASVAQETWYAEASDAASGNGPAPALHMVLNLDRLVPLPYFRSYWVQQNVTELQRYRAGVSDLDMSSSGTFAERRVLLPKSIDSAADEAYLQTLLALVPATGVYRATATHDAGTAVTALEEKLLGRITLDALPDKSAPDPSLDAPQSGSVSDLEVRIDTPPLVTPAISNQALAAALNAAGLDAVLTFSSAQKPASEGGLWVPIHSAVILQSASAWNALTMQAALQQSLRGALTAANLGIDFHSETVAGQAVYTLDGPKPLFFATLSVALPTAPTKVNLCLLTDDRALLLTLLDNAGGLAKQEFKMAPQRSTLLAGFDHASQRAPYARLTSLIDGTNQRKAGTDEPDTPVFFSGDMRSLSDSFASLATERFEERRDGSIVRQTVTYEWKKP